MYELNGVSSKRVMTSRRRKLASMDEAVSLKGCGYM